MASPTSEHLSLSPSPADERPIVRLAADADHRVALFGPLLLSVWIGETRVEALRAMREMAERSAPSAPNGRLGLFVVVERQAITPSAAVREELAHIRRAKSIALTALVHEGGGFSAALVRGIVTSLNLLERAESRAHVFADVASAARWVAMNAPQYGESSAIEAAVRTLRTASP